MRGFLFRRAAGIENFGKRHHIALFIYLGLEFRGLLLRRAA
jgi:hypothetical protein